MRSKGFPTLGIAIAVAALYLTTAACAGAAGGAASSSQTYSLKATLDRQHQVPVPKDATAAKGSFSGTLVVAGKKSSFVWRLKFSGLSGRALAAHIDIAAPGKAGVVALPLCTKCVPNAHGAYTGSYVASSAFVKAMLHGGMYATITTKLNPKGEIRGRIKASSA